jgi:hypothetical protein
MAYERSSFNIYFSFLSFGINFVLLHGGSKRWDVAVNGGTEGKKGLKNRRRARKQRNVTGRRPLVVDLHL